MKFKIGDHVEIVNDESLVDVYKAGDTAFVIGEMYGYIVVAMEKDGIPQLALPEDVRSIADDDDAFFSAAMKNEGRKILAVIIDSRKRTVTVSDGEAKGVAKCSPEDVFDEETGVNLAVERYYKPVKFPAIGDKYYFADFDGTVGMEFYEGEDYEKNLIEMGNLFRTKEEAEKLAKKFVEAAKR